MGKQFLSRAVLDLSDPELAERASAPVQSFSLTEPEEPGWIHAACRTIVDQAKRLLAECTIAVMTFDRAAAGPHVSFYSRELGSDACRYCDGALTKPALLAKLDSYANDESVRVSENLHKALTALGNGSLPGEFSPGHAVACTFELRPSLDLAVWAWKPKSFGAFDEVDVGVVREVGRLVKALLAVGIDRELNQIAGLSRILDQIDTGLFVINSRLEVAEMNHRAEAILRDANYFIESQNQLHLNDKLAESRILQILSRMASRRTNDGATDGAIVGIQGLAGDGLAKAGVAVLRTADDAILGPPRFALTLACRDRAATFTSDQLMKIGLTRAEAELTAALLKGSTVSQYADTKGLAVSTVRAHLKSVMMRLGVHRQSELVRAVLSMF